MSPKQRDEDSSGSYVDRKLLGENGQGGIRTHDTREGIPVLEANGTKAESFVESTNPGAVYPIRLYAKANQSEVFAQH